MKPITNLAFRLGLVGLMLAPLCASAQDRNKLRERWLSDVVNTVDEVGRGERAYELTRSQLLRKHEAIQARSAVNRDDYARAKAAAAAACRDSNDPYCHDAQAAVQEAHLALSESVASRLKIEAQMHENTMQWASTGAAQLAQLLNKARALNGQGKDAKAVDKVRLKLLKRARKFAVSGARELIKAKGFLESVEANAELKGKVASAKNVAKALIRYNKQARAGKSGKGTTEKQLAGMQSLLTSLAAVSRIGRDTISAQAAQLKMVNAMAWATSAQGEVVRAAGGLHKVAKALNADIGEFSARNDADLHILQAGLAPMEATDADLDLFDDGDLGLDLGGDSDNDNEQLDDLAKELEELEND